MYIVDLECGAGHVFEGWYDSVAEYRALETADEVTCPLCEGRARRLPSASRISTTTTRGEKRSAPVAPPGVVASPPVTPPQLPLEVQKALAAIVQQVRRTHVDVGEDFATRALSMHRGDEDARPIRGTATADEEERLSDEGVPFAKLPIPDIETN